MDLPPVPEAPFAVGVPPAAEDPVPAEDAFLPRLLPSGVDVEVVGVPRSPDDPVDPEGEPKEPPL